MFNPEAELLVVVNGKDEDGFAIEEKKSYPALVLQEKSVTRTEKYLASNGGTGMAAVEPKIILVIRREDWEQTGRINKETGRKEYATQVLYDGAVWDIIREYHANRSTAELTIG